MADENKTMADRYEKIAVELLGALVIAKPELLEQEINTDSEASISKMIELYIKTLEKVKGMIDLTGYPSI